MNTKTLQSFFLITRLILTIVLLVFIFSKVSPNSVWRVLHTADQTYIFLAGLLLFLYILLKNYKRRIIAKDMYYKETFTYGWIHKILTTIQLKGSRVKLGSVNFIDRFSEVWIAVFLSY